MLVAVVFSVIYNVFMIQKRTRGELVIETFPIGSFACNCSMIYSIKTKEAIIIDPGNDFKTLDRMIKERGLFVKKLLHTHAHFDHIGQSSEVHISTGATIHLHKEDLFLYEALEQQGMFFGQTVGKPVDVHGFLEHEQEFGLEDSGLNNFLKTLHTPGHTPGSCCFYTDYFDVPVLFAGDTLFQSSIGRTDLPGGDSNKIIKSIKDELLTLPGETGVITGHGPETLIHLEKSGNPFLC